MSSTGLTEAQRQDVEHFDAYWQQLFDRGRIERIVPPDAEIWTRDLGRARRVAFEWMGELSGCRVLELGCGPGDEAIMMARRGAHVTALDIAPSSVAIVQARARANGVDSHLEVACMTAEQLAFPGASFDAVVGFGLLHHADPVALGPEVKRVLRPNGKALFFEPLGMNPVLEFARNHLPYRDKHHSLNDRPLRYEQIRRVGQSFRITRRREFYLFSMISRAVGGEMSFPWLWSLDEFLIERVPVIRSWCRYILVEYSA